MLQHAFPKRKKRRLKDRLKRDISLSVTNRLIMVGPLNEPFNYRDSKKLRESSDPLIKELS